ncbi:hypothetical protein, partial [Kistimonas scapharcae]|uniref:hypothetical protein n=1 Tax=Kistimonas scapharcae TaxID=1036133 RepID=UPI0031EE4C23
FRDWQILSNTPHAGCHVVCTGVFEYLRVVTLVGGSNTNTFVLTVESMTSGNPCLKTGCVVITGFQAN